MTTPLQSRRLVVGCGYLGERLAARWLTEGSRVWGVVRSESRAAELAARGIEAVVRDVTAANSPAGLPEVDTVVWSVSYDRGSGQSYHDVHVAGLRRLLDSLPGQPRIVFISSTGVWGDEDGNVVDEQTEPHPARDAGRVLLEAESLLGNHPLGPGTSLRLAGIYGPDRLPRLDDLRAGRPLAADPDSWLNLIHVDDAASVVMAVASHPSPGPLYVVSDGRPVRRRDFYSRLADLTGSPPPEWTEPAAEGRGGDKRVDPGRLFAEIRPSLAHPDALLSLAGMLAVDGTASPPPDRPPGSRP